MTATPHSTAPPTGAHTDAASSPRRAFLKGGAAAAAGLTLGTASSYARIIGANDRVRIGCIGVGNRGESLLKAILKGCPQAEVAALCDVYDPYLDHARELAGPAASVFRDYRRLLEDPGIDAVVIATPDHWHALNFVDACRAGKDVYVEKPLSLTVGEGRIMADTARSTGRVTQMGAQRHSSPYVVEACGLIRGGAIGKVTRVRFFHLTNEFPEGIGRRTPTSPPPGLDWDMWLGPAPKIPFQEVVWNYKFRWFWSYSGGQMTNMGTHYIDVIQMALGQDAPMAVTALGGRFAVEDDREIPDTMEAVWQYRDCLVSFTQVNANAAEGAPGAPEIEFRGTLGTLILTGGGWEIIPEAVQDGPYHARGPLARKGNRSAKKIEARSGRGGIDHEGHLRNFFDCVKSRDKCACDAETGHRSTTSTLLANIALRTQSVLRWDREREMFRDNPEADKLLHCDYRAPWSLKA